MDRMEAKGKIGEIRQLNKKLTKYDVFLDNFIL